MSVRQCHFDYAYSFWYPGISNMLRNRLQATQNKIIRFILQMDPRTHIGSDTYRSLRWLPVIKGVDKIILDHVFKVRSVLSPEYMLEQFIPASSVHSHDTRFRENGCFVIPKLKCFGKRSFDYNDCVLWSDLPNSIKTLQRHQQFKGQFSKHVFFTVSFVYIIKIQYCNLFYIFSPCVS